MAARSPAPLPHHTPLGAAAAPGAGSAPALSLSNHLARSRFDSATGLLALRGYNNKSRCDESIGAAWGQLQTDDATYQTNTGESSGRRPRGRVAQLEHHP